MKQNILILLLVFFTLSSTAQTILLSVDNTNEKVTEVGPNLKRHNQIFFRLGLVEGSDKPGARIVFGKSTDFAFGFRKKYKISSLYSFGFETELQSRNYKFKQTAEKIFPDTIINKSQSLNYGNLGLGFYNRFNFDPHRGNFLGTFLDLGIVGSWHFGTHEFSENELSNGTTETKMISDLDYVKKLSASAYARIGFSHISIFSSYRLTELFKKSYKYPALPRLVVGIELSAF